MQKLVIAMVAFGAFAFGQGKAAPKDKFLPIVFDDWWNVDYVKNGCELAASNGNPCPMESTPADVVKEFENELVLAFASESACHGLSLTHFTPEMANAAVKNPNAPATGAAATMAGDSWSFMLDLDGHSRTQQGGSWTLVDKAQHVLNGHISTPLHTMQQVCKVVKGIGGKVEN
jgi:hypothetical protein